MKERIYKQNYLLILLANLLVIAAFMCGCINQEGNLEKNLKAKWYEDALKMLQTNYSKIKIAIVYHEKWQNYDGTWSDLRINSSPQAL